nr:TIGR02677 family protein [Rhodococcus triatomae]
MHEADPVGAGGHPGIRDTGGRLRVFSFATAEKRVEYLWVLRAFEQARSRYVVLLHAADVSRILGEIGDGVSGESGVSGEPLPSPDVAALLDQLHQWGVLERTHDGSRAATLAEYRNRHFVYQFTDLGFEAFRAVEGVLAAGPDEVSLSRAALPDLLADLTDLADANRDGDAERVARKLGRLDATLSDMADRAARFYLSLGTMVRTTDVTPETFLAHKDALLTHMREFSSDLARYAPRLATAIREVEESDIDLMVARAVAHDGRILRPLNEREADWRQRWAGLAQWFVAADGALSEADRLRDGTMSAIAAVLALLRRVTENRKGGVSRDSQLRHVAGWFAAAPTEDAAHALFQAVFDLDRPRHLSGVHPRAEETHAGEITEEQSWWEAPPVEISRTLAETGRAPAAGVPHRVHRDGPGVRRLRDAQLAAQRSRAGAAASLAEAGAYTRPLTEPETDVLLRLLDTALSSRATVSGSVHWGDARDGGAVLTVRPGEGATVVDTARGRLYLDGIEVDVR